MTDDIDALLHRTEEGWESLPRNEWMTVVPNFVSGDPEGHRLRVRYYRRKTDNALVGRVWFGPGAEGPPGHAHGGSMAAVLDEVMGTAGWLNGSMVVAASIKIDFRNKLRLGSVISFEAWVDRVDGRKVFTKGRLVSDKGVTVAESEGLFIKLRPEQTRDLSKWVGNRFSKDKAPG